jgi:ribosomal protein S27AE
MLAGEMTTIRTTCPRCGEVDMGPEAISLSVRSGGREGSYRFTCPSCADGVEKRADRKIVALLVSAGVDLERRGEEPMDELFADEAALEERPTGPPLTADDVIEFHYLLQDDAYIRAFFARSDGV